MTEMCGSWLIQRLDKPFARAGALIDNPFAFGGGRRNGGLSQEAMDVIRKVWSFDYMGAAEYEWGAVPKALQMLADSRESLVGFSFEVDNKDIEKPWSTKSKKVDVPDGSSTVYVVCHGEWVAEVEKRVRSWIKPDAYKDAEYPIRDGLMAGHAFFPSEDWHRTQGWLELENGFLFFSSREMWENTCTMFGVEPCTP